MLLQVPGGVELMVMMVVALLLFGVTFVVIVLAGIGWIRSGRDDEEVARQLAELQAEIQDLRTELEESESPDGGSGPFADDGEETRNDGADGA